MNNFIFENSTKVIFGQGCVKEYLACKVKPFATILLAYGGGSIQKNGIYQEVTSILENAGKTVVEFPGIQPNPTYGKVLEGAKLAREHNVDMVLAVGGGSVMDCAKAVSLVARYGGDVWEDYWERPGIIRCQPLPLGVVVTAAGTGSECNGGAVITHEGKKIKTGRDYPQLNPKFALMDPTYTYSVPVKQMVSGGFDILSHLMETYFSEPNQDNVSDDVMEALMKSVIRNLRAAIQNPKDYTARSNLLWDSTLGENRLVKMLHPVYYRHIYKEGVPKFVKFAENVWAIPRKGKTDEELALASIEALADFIQEVGLPTSLKELGVEKAQLKEIANSCGISQGSYKRLTHQEIYQIFQECYE